MIILTYISQLIENNYLHFSDDRKRSMFILILINFLLLFISGIWIPVFTFLEMFEMLWVDIVVFLGTVGIMLGIIFYTIPFEMARFVFLILCVLMAGTPGILYGIESNAYLHLIFLPIVMILLFSRKEHQSFLVYLGAVILLYLVVIFANFYYGAFYTPPADKFFIYKTILAMDSLFVALYITYFSFIENSKYKALLANEREKSDQLLLSIFPETIADKLRHSNQSVADSFEEITILFADIVGFTQYANTKTPTELVEMLDEVFSEFDGLLDKYNIEKIKTIGDAYMAVSGLPQPDVNHCQNVADLALEINQIIETKFSEKYDLKLRIGINTGKAVAGVIGNKKFSYDLWGDSVNIASRFEAGGQPGRIHVTQAVKDKLGDAYIFDHFGEVSIKGKGMMQSYFLEEKKKVTPVEVKFSKPNLEDYTNLIFSPH